MRSDEEQEVFEMVKAWAAMGPKRREVMLETLALITFQGGLPKHDKAQRIATNILCLLDACPMSPKEMGRLLRIDAETAVFKNALTGLRKAGMVVAEGPKHDRIYRLTRAGS